VGAQTSRAGVGGLSGGIGASGGGASGAGGLSGGFGGSGMGSGVSGGGVSGGTGLSGGTASFSGGQALQGGLGNSNSVSGASASTYMPNSGGSVGRTGLMGSYFSNPYALGLAYSGMTQSTFGQPLYNLQSLSSGTGTVGGLGTTAGRVGSYSGGAGAGGGVGVSGGRVGGGVGVSGGRVGGGGAGVSGGRVGGVGYGSSSSFGMNGGLGSTSGNLAPVASTYAINVRVDAPTPPLTTVRTDIQGIIDRSSRLPSRANIQVLTDGTTVVLRGAVASQHEADVAELTARLAPGVVSLRNELQVRPSPGTTTTARTP
jgi:hypothetical protein